MRILSVLLLAALVGVVALGSFGSHAGMQNHGGDCSIAASLGADCPIEASPAAYAAFHFGALKGFSITALTVGVTALLLLSFFILYVRAAALTAREETNRTDPELFVSAPNREILHWLSLRENSPSSI